MKRMRSQTTAAPKPLPRPLPALRRGGKKGLPVGLIIFLTLGTCSCEAGKILKTNTAVILAVGPFVDFSDGVTPETAMTVTNITMELFKETDEGSAPTRSIGVNPTASGGSNDMVHITSDVAGFYSIELTASNVNFLGRATLVFTDPDVCLPVFVPITVVSDQIFSSLIEDDDELQVHTSEITGDLITASVIAADAIGADEMAASAIGASELAADAIGSSEIAASAIGASELATDSITSDEVGSTAVTEIQTGLATSAGMTTLIGSATADVILEVNANETKIDTLDTVADGIQTDLSNGTDGLGALKLLIDAVDLVVDAIKVKTDPLNFTGTDVKATLDGEAVAVDAGAVWDATVSINGATTGEMLRRLHSFGAGKVLKSGDVYSYYDADAATLIYSATHESATRTVTAP